MGVRFAFIKFVRRNAEDLCFSADPPCEDVSRLGVEQECHRFVRRDKSDVIIVFVPTQKAHVKFALQFFVLFFVRFLVGDGTFERRFRRQRVFVFHGRCAQILRFVSPFDAERDGALGKGLNAVRKEIVALGASVGHRSSQVVFAQNRYGVFVCGGTLRDESDFDEIADFSAYAVERIGRFSGNAGERERKLVALGNKQIVSFVGNTAFVTDLFASDEAK